MNGATSVIAELRERGVDVSRHGDGIRLRGPQDALDPALVRQVRENKAALLAWLERTGRVLNMSLREFERQSLALELRVPWWPETLWLVPREEDAGLLQR